MWLRRWYVRRFCLVTGARAWSGPFSARRSRNEAAAWRAAGWSVSLWASTPEVRARVREWKRDPTAGGPHAMRKPS